MVGIFHEVRRNSDSIATNFEGNTVHFSQKKIARVVQSIRRVVFIICRVLCFRGVL